jgi:hypothetical protein
MADQEKVPDAVQDLLDARDEQDSYAKENGLPTYEEIEAARAEGRASGLVFGTGVPTGVGDFTLNTADSMQRAEAVAEAAANNTAITVDAQPGGTTQVGVANDLSDDERQDLADAGVRDAGDPNQVGTADSETAGRQTFAPLAVPPDAQSQEEAGRTEASTNYVDPENNGDDESSDDEGDESARTAKEIVADIESADSTERVSELESEGSQFATVRKAADKRREQLDSDESDENVTSVTADNPDSITVEH